MVGEAQQVRLPVHAPQDAQAPVQAPARRLQDAPHGLVEIALLRQHLGDGELRGLARLARAQRLLVAAALRDVREHGEGAHQAAVLEDGRGGGAQPDEPSLLVPETELETLGRAVLAAAPRLARARDVLLRHELEGIAAEQLLGPVPEHLRQALVGVDGRALGVDVPDPLL